jgi:hypothetical protein
MASVNTSYGPASCMKFNSSFLYFIGFFVLLVIGYMWGKRTGTKEQAAKSKKSKPSKPSKGKSKTKSKK